MFKTPQQKWEEAKADPDRWIPRFPVKPCPHCGQEPMFIRLFGPGKYGKLTWNSFDYCGRIWADDDAYIGNAIAFWQEIVHNEMRAIDKAAKSDIVHTTSTESPPCSPAKCANPTPSSLSASSATPPTSAAVTAVGSSLSRWLTWMTKFLRRTNVT